MGDQLEIGKSSNIEKHFAKTADEIYLLAHSIGLMPASTPDAIQTQFLDIWQSNPTDAWPKWLDAISEFKIALSELFNGDASAFCPQTNISSGLTKVIQSFPKSADRKNRNTILLTENDFPSVGFVLKKTESMGFNIRVIPRSEDPQDLETWKNALTDDVCCALITHSHYNTSRLIPVEGITRITRERDIISIVDVAQSSGVVPIDLKRWRADVILGSCIKWLCGGPGAGFLWVDPDLVSSLMPVDVGWFSHQNPFEFDIHNFDYAADSSRFWGGTPNVLPFVLATNSIKWLTDFGIENIREHNQKLTSLLADSINKKNIISPLDCSERGGTLVVKFPEHEKVSEALERANVRFDSREEGIRLSPHIYTTADEINQIASVLNKAG